uniref:Uncharacterized protein n=1 Tax=Glossina palpalis gambiensis TaxID=67801 RepID=A0A1B0BP90_9MUSC
MDDQTELKTGVDAVQYRSKKLDKALLALNVARLKALDGAFDAFNKVQTKIVEKKDFDKISQPNRSKYEELYYCIATRLKDRFENKKIIGNQHIKQIFKHPKIIYANAADLRELIDHMNNHLIGLKNINRPVESWDGLMVYIITSKLESDTLNKWNEKAPIDRVPILSELLNFLKGRCQILDSNLSSVSLPTSRAIEPKGFKEQQSLLLPLKIAAAFAKNRVMLYIAVLIF